MPYPNSGAGMTKRLGKFERQQAKLGAAWRASKASDNLKIPLREVIRHSDTASPMNPVTLQSKGARGGFSPFGSARKGHKSTASKRFGNR
jgi:hypothetical protein